MAPVFPDGEVEDAAELGAVDDRSVRVWIRRPGVETASARLEVEGCAPAEGMTRLSADTDWTGVIDLSLAEPAPDRPFVCTVDGRRLTGRLAPEPGRSASFTFAFGSCHQPFAIGQRGRLRVTPAAGIYPAMRADLGRTAARFLLLLGDQFYSDALAPLSVRTLFDEQGAPPPLTEALAAYRRICRGFFGEAGMRAVREAVPTYCMWDDHDIFQDWGSLVDVSPVDRRLFEAAAQVYCEYQHGRNPGGAIGPPPYPYAFRSGDAGFLMLDLRGARDYQHERLLGGAQWAAVHDYLHGDDARTLQTLFIGATIPIAHVSRWLVHLFEHLPGNAGHEVRDRWCSEGFVASRDALLEELFAWQTAAPHRQVILLSGDVHAAGAFTIRRRRGPGVVQQFTSSAFTSPLTRVEALLNVVATRAPNLFEPGLRIDRRLLILENNYGLVQVAPQPEGGHRVRLTVRAWDRHNRALRTAGQVVSQPDQPLATTAAPDPHRHLWRPFGRALLRRQARR